MTDINQENLYLLLPGIVAGVARIYAEENGCSKMEAIQRSILQSYIRVLPTSRASFGISGLWLSTRRC